MKILYVNNARISSGAEDHMVDMASWMKEHGQEPVFLITTGSVLERQLGEIGVPFHPVFDKTRRLSLPLRIGKAILAERPDVISINREHNILPVLYSTRLVSPRLRKKPKMVAVFHTPTGRYYPGLMRSSTGSSPRPTTRAPRSSGQTPLDARTPFKDGAAAVWGGEDPAAAAQAAIDALNTILAGGQ